MPRWVSGLIFFGSVLLLWGGLHLYVYWRLGPGLALPPWARLALKLGLPVLGLMYLVGRFLEGPLGEASLVLLWPGAVWMGILSILVSLLVVYEVGLTLPLAGLKMAHVVSAETATRVARWGVVAVVVAAGGLSAWGLVTVAQGPRVTEVEVRMPGLPQHLDGFRLIQASDIHVGGTIGAEMLDRIARTIDEQDADLVVLVGDLTDETNGGDGTAFERLARVKSRHGVVASTGNHEFYVGGEAVVRTLEERGIPVLRQGHRTIADGLVVAGIDDPAFLGGRGGIAQAMDAALAGRPGGLPVVLLSHQPLGVREAAERGVSLMLSGHTHGGQIPPFTLLTGLAYPFLEGLHRVGDLAVYVSRGAGYWGPPLRVFADPEITRLVLRRA